MGDTSSGSISRLIRKKMWTLTQTITPLIVNRTIQPNALIGDASLPKGVTIVTTRKVAVVELEEYDEAHD